MEIKACAQCGIPFPAPKNKMYCSNACKQNAFREKHSLEGTDNNESREADAPILQRSDVIWFMEWCLEYCTPQRISQKDLTKALDKFKHILDAFWLYCSGVEQPYLEMVDVTNIDDMFAHEPLVVDMMCIRDILQELQINGDKNSFGYMLDFYGEQNFDIYSVLKCIYKKIKHYLANPVHKHTSVTVLENVSAEV